MYSFYFVLLTTLIHFVATARTGQADPEHLVKLRDFVKPYFTCPAQQWYIKFYTCPSHFWPEIIQKVVPAMEELSAWMMQKLGGDLWAYMAYTVGPEITNYKVEELVQVEEESKAWRLLNRYLMFASEFHGMERTCECLTITLNSLTDVDLGQVAKLPYGGNSDRFDEINELVNDPKKARLLDGLKRASRDDFEMTRMLKSLTRWLKRPFSEGSFKALIYHTAFKAGLKSMPTERLRSKTVTAPDFEKNTELRDLVRLFFRRDFRAHVMSSALSKESMPPFPGRDYLVDFMTRLREETEGNKRCRESIATTIRVLYMQTELDDIHLSFNMCVMKGLSQLPDSFFNDYQALGEVDQIKFQKMLTKASLPEFDQE